MKTYYFLFIFSFCSAIISGYAQKQTDSIQIDIIIKKFEELKNQPRKTAEFIAEIDHQYLEKYGQELYPYIKKQYDDLEDNTDLPLALKFEVIFLLKNNYYLFGERDKAAKLAYEMLDISKQLNDSLLYYYSYISIADIEVEMGNQQNSLEFLLKAQKYAAIDPSALAQTYIDLASLYLDEAELELAEKNVLYGIDLAEDAEDFFQLSYGYSILMNFYIFKEDYENALVSYNKVKQIIKNHHFLETSRVYGNVTIRAAQVYKELGNYNKSGELYSKAHQLALESNDRHNLAVIYEEWSELEELKGNYTTSLEYFKKHADLNNTLYNEASISQINTLKTVYELENKELEIKAAQQEQKNTQRQLWLFVFCGLIFIAALVILAFLLRSKLKTEQLKAKLIAKQNKISKIEVENLEREVQLKNKELADLFLHQYEKANLLNDVIETVDYSSEKIKDAIQQHQNQKKDWDSFKAHFDQVHEGFFDKLNALSSELTPKDIRFCAYIRMNLSAKEIAIMLGISYRTVQGIRSRVRKKINLDSKEDLVKFLMNL